MSEKGIVMIDQRIPNREETPVLDDVFRQIREDTEMQNRRMELDIKYDKLAIVALVITLVGWCWVIAAIIYDSKYILLAGGIGLVGYIFLAIITWLAAIGGRKV